MWNRYKTELFSVTMLLLVLAGSTWIFYDFLPRTLRRDDHGVPHGTGVQRYHYQSGKLMLEETYRAGQLLRSIWYDPTGKVLQQTEWVNGTGEGIYLREDGSIRKRMQYVNGQAEGKAVSYASDGAIEREVWYRKGQPLTTRPAHRLFPQ